MFYFKTDIKNDFPQNKINKFLLLLFLAVLNIFFITANLNAANETYSITLPQKITGVEKLEYVINGQAQGSTSGKTSADITSGASLYFLLKIEPNGYSQLPAKNVKIVSDKGTSLNLRVFEYDENQNITLRNVADDELIDPEQTYASSVKIINKNETFHIEGIELDKFDTDINLENTDISINEALNVNCQDSNGNNVSAIFNETNNSYTVKGITINSSLKLWINTKPGYSQSEITFLSSDPYMTQEEIDESLLIPAVTSDVNITVQNVVKNRYSLSFTSYSDASFKYKKDGSQNDFEPAPLGSLTVTHGESYSFTCETTEENTLSGKEITANAVAVRAVNGVYSLSEISEDTNIAITGKNDSLYKIDLPHQEAGVIVNDTAGNILQNPTVRYGLSFEFKISPIPAYTQNVDYALIYAVPKNKVLNNDYNTEENPAEAQNYILTPSGSGIFTVPSIEEPMTIIVKNLEINRYKVNLPQVLTGASYTVTSSEYATQLLENRYSVIHGKSLEINLTADWGRSVSDVTLVSDNNPNVQISKNENKYTVENITGDTDIIIDNVTDAKYEVTFSGTGILCKNEIGNIFENNKTAIVHETGTVRFKAEPNEGYEIGAGGINVSLKSGNAVLTAPSDNNEYYTVSNATENAEIEITGMILKTVTVSFSFDNNSVEFLSASGNNGVLPENNPIIYGSDFDFKVRSTSGEDISNINLGTNNSTEIILGEDNVYSLKNVTEDTTVTVFQSFQAARFQQASTATEGPPNYWSVAKNVELALKPSYVGEFDNDSSPPPPPKNNYVSGLTSLKADPLSYEFIFEYKGNYANEDLIDAKLYYYNNEGFLIEIPNQIVSTYYSIDIAKSFIISADNKKTFTFNIIVRRTSTFFSKPYHECDFSSFGGGIEDDTLNIFDTIQLAAHYKDEYDPTQTVNYALLPPPKGAKYYSVTPVFENQTFYYTEEEELTQPIYLKPSGHFFQFIVKLDEGYEMDEDAVKIRPDNTAILWGPLPNVTPSENRYLYRIVDRGELNIQVYIESVRKKTYDSKFFGTGTNFLNEKENQFLEKTFEHGDSFSFTTTPKEGFKNEELTFKLITEGTEYELETPTEANPNTAINEADNVKLQANYNSDTKKITYTLSDIKGDFNIKVDRNRIELKVYFEIYAGIRYCIVPDDEDAEPEEILNLAEGQSVEYDRRFSFIIKAEEGYDITNITVTANHQILNFINGKYTIKGVTQNNTVRVSNISKLSNKVTFTQYEGITFKDTEDKLMPEEKQINYDEYIEFKIVLSKAYAGSEIKAHAEYSSGANKDFINHTELPLPDDPDPPCFDTNTKIYKIKVKENIRIYIDGMSLNNHNVKLAKIEGITYYNQYGTEKLTSDSPPGSDEEDNFIVQSVVYGNSLSFKAVADEGYDTSNLAIYSKKSSIGSARTQMFPSSGVYTLENITEEYIITAENISKTAYQIEFRVVEGGKCIDDRGNEIGNTVSVTHGSDFSFNISLDSAYNNSNPTVNVKGTTAPIEPNPDKSYTIRNITGNKIVEIINITKNAYKATFKEAEGVIYKTAKNKPFTGSLDVEYGSTLYFKIFLLDAYDKSSPWVLLDGEKTLGENGGLYSLSNIRDNVEIVVKNVVKNPEEVTMDDINNVPDEVTSESDIDSVVKATQTYIGLSDEMKAQVLSISKLEKAQQKAGVLNHKSGDITINGIDWNIKLTVVSLNDDKSKMEDFSKKVDRRSLLSLYEVSLVDTLTNKVYEVPYGQKVSVIMPAPDLTGYKNTVVVHEKSSGSIEYLDVNIVNGTAQFETSSFSLFGIAAKQIPNYAQSPSDIKISVSSLVENEEELQTLLGEGLVSQLGSLIEQDDGTPANGKTDTVTDSQADGSSSEITDSTSSAGSDNIISDIINKINLDKAYDWAVNNELISVILILLIGSMLITVIIVISKKQNKKS